MNMLCQRTALVARLWKPVVWSLLGVMIPLLGLSANGSCQGQAIPSARAAITGSALVELQPAALGEGEGAQWSLTGQFQGVVYPRSGAPRRALTGLTSVSQDSRTWTPALPEARPSDNDAVLFSRAVTASFLRNNQVFSTLSGGSLDTLGLPPSLREGLQLRSMEFTFNLTSQMISAWRGNLSTIRFVPGAFRFELLGERYSSFEAMIPALLTVLNGGTCSTCMSAPNSSNTPPSPVVPYTADELRLYRDNPAALSPERLAELEADLKAIDVGFTGGGSVTAGASNSGVNGSVQVKLDLSYKTHADVATRHPELLQLVVNQTAQSTAAAGATAIAQATNQRSWLGRWWDATCEGIKSIVDAVKGGAFSYEF